jgi:hypothetical protein
MGEFFVVLTSVFQLFSESILGVRMERKDV